ncbi:MAG: hypothetical protein COV69_01845 [Parcubacteria group bacterium CG11_big_fil_rev_8_21_14_0_20_39_14]|nr:MAG: hypothetical protein COV69_01845 [Parcubacteria group bacterium CG11_big_fil_rev_8_21_14_0_20_39_14]PIS34992.1 MAG: hypothetical protein COT36_04775 [Parcubacteria group bacterium CG08_land_8_20_14_0_20_38_56]
MGFKLLIGFLILFVLVKLANEIIDGTNHKRILKLLKNGGPLLEKLVEEIEKRKITLAPLGPAEKLIKPDPQKNISIMISMLYPARGKKSNRLLKVLRGVKPKIVLPENQFRELLREKINIGEMEALLAHEIGHHIIGLKTLDCPIIKQQTGKKAIITSCLFDELRATEEGLKLIDKIWGIQNWRIELRGKEVSGEYLFNYLLSRIYRQCLNCVAVRDGRQNECPKIQEIDETRERIERLLIFDKTKQG